MPLNVKFEKCSITDISLKKQRPEGEAGGEDRDKVLAMEITLAGEVSHEVLAVILAVDQAAAPALWTAEGEPASRVLTAITSKAVFDNCSLKIGHLGQKPEGHREIQHVKIRRFKVKPAAGRLLEMTCSALIVDIAAKDETYITARMRDDIEAEIIDPDLFADDGKS